MFFLFFLYLGVLLIYSIPNNIGLAFFCAFTNKFQLSLCFCVNTDSKRFVFRGVGKPCAFFDTQAFHLFSLWVQTNYSVTTKKSQEAILFFLYNSIKFDIIEVARGLITSWFPLGFGG